MTSLAHSRSVAWSGQGISFEEPVLAGIPGSRYILSMYAYQEYAIWLSFHSNSLILHTSGMHLYLENTDQGWERSNPYCCCKENAKFLIATRYVYLSVLFLVLKKKFVYRRSIMNETSPAWGLKVTQKPCQYRASIETQIVNQVI